MANPTENWISRQELCEQYPIPKTRPGLTRFRRVNNFPKPFYVTPNQPMWDKKVVDAWFVARQENTTHKAARTE
jgi:hypothetical protein